jgi:hypothetical protein
MVTCHNEGDMKSERHAHIFKWQADNSAMLIEKRRKEVQHHTALNVACTRRREAIDPAFKVLNRLRGRIGAALRNRADKSHTTRQLLGCPLPDLIKHLESQFTEGMTWKNYGEWHVDHIKPCCGFNLTAPEQQRSCFHFTNLRPLWAIDNWRKIATDRRQSSVHRLPRTFL